MWNFKGVLDPIKILVHKRNARENNRIGRQLFVAFCVVTASECDVYVYTTALLDFRF